MAGTGTGAGGQGGTGFRGGFGGAAATGQVVSVNGSTIVIAANDGTQVTVNASGATITKPTQVDASALQPGQLVIVAGTRNADGTVTATQVQATNGFGGANANGAAGTPGGARAAAPPTTTPSSPTTAASG